MKHSLIVMVMVSMLTHIAAAGMLYFLIPGHVKPAFSEGSDTFIWSFMEGAENISKDQEEKGEGRGPEKPDKKNSGRIDVAEEMSFSDIHAEEDPGVEVIARIESNPESQAEKVINDPEIEQTQEISRTQQETVSNDPPAIYDYSEDEKDVSMQDSIKKHVNGGEHIGIGNVGQTSSNESLGKRGQVLRSFLEDLRQEIEMNKRYPRFARINGIEGTVLVHLSVDRDGAPISITIDTSSGAEILDKSAMRTVRSLKKIRTLPDEIIDMDITIPIVYRLQER